MVRVQGLDTLRVNPMSGCGEGYCTFCYTGMRPSFSQRGFFGRHGGWGWRNWLYLGYPMYGWRGASLRPEQGLSEPEEEYIF